MVVMRDISVAGIPSDLGTVLFPLVVKYYFFP
jgi:hypothetical protein